MPDRTPADDASDRSDVRAARAAVSQSTDAEPYMERTELKLTAAPERLDSEQWIAELIQRLVTAFDLTLYDQTIHRFAPKGITGIAIIGESHISVHTWPEYAFAHVELLTCEQLPPADAIAAEVRDEDVAVDEVVTDG